MEKAQAELTAYTDQQKTLIAERGSIQDKLDQYQKAIGQLNQIAKVMDGYDSRKDFIKDKNSYYTLRNGLNLLGFDMFPAKSMFKATMVLFL